MHVQIKHFLAYLQDLNPTLAGVITYMSSTVPAEVVIKFQRYARECFICTCIWLHV